ncbi:MAG: FG-GAP-like repeat-containing protein [Pseudomonadota bacterium]
MTGHAATSPVGATAGSFAVSPSGAATYSIPIVVPPGTNGMAPSISLNYNSQGGNGLVGMGWSIGGLSVIHRCGATITIDGFKGGVNYDANDRFCLDGERLIWDAANGFYRTQHESWQKVSVVGSYFTVTTKDGTVMTYGDTADSQIMAQGRPSIVRLWALSRIQDTSGNYLTFTYQNNGFTTGEYYPASIAYTGNGGVAPYNFVYFDYPTSSRSDVIQGYEGGSLISTTKLLAGIRTCTGSACTQGSTLVRNYVLAYDNDGAVRRSRLTSVKECGVDGICLPATTFGWQQGSVGFNTALQWVQQGASEPAQMQYADVNGDGKMDALYFDTSRSNQVWVGSSTGTAFAAASPWVSYSSSTPAQIQYADVNGDGRPDALYADTSGNRALVSLSTGGGFNAPSGWATFSAYSSTLDPAQVQYADVDGDGKADLIYQGPDNAFRVALSSGMGFGTPVVWVQHGGSFTAGQAQYADVNGDGRADLIFQASGNSFSVSLSTGTGFTTPVLWAQHGGGFTAGQARYVDLNGDGRADLVFHGNDGQLWVSLSTSAAFTAPVAWAQPAIAQPGASYGVSGSQVFTTVGPVSFTVPAGVYSLRISMAGGGGGGGGGNNWGDWGSGGGGGGGYSQYVMAVTPGQVITGTVGAGGPAGGYSGSGSNGTDTFFGSLAAQGGVGGQYQCCGGAGGSPGGQPGSTSNSGAGGDSGAGQGQGGDSGSPGGIYGGGGGGGDTSSYWPAREGAQGWIYVEWVSILDQVQYSDANGDGMADAIYFNVNDNSIWVYLSTGSGFLQGAMWGQLGPGSSVGSQMRYADVNGDGLPDALYFDTFRSNGVWVSTTKGAPPDLVTSIVNGLNVQTAVTYKPLTAATVYVKNSSASYPYQDDQDATYVVSDTYQSSGVSGGMNRTSYRYLALRKHHAAHTSLGFQNITTTDVAGQTTTWYLQTLDGTEGAVWQSWRYTLQGAPVHELYNTWTPVNLGSGRTLALLSDTAEGSLDPDIFFTYLTQTTTTYSSFDSYYNPQTITVSTSDGFTKTTANTYNNASYIGQLTQSRVTAQAPGQTALIRTSSFTYDSANRLASETIEPGSTMWLTSTYVYDPIFGNRIKKTVTGADITPRDEYILQYYGNGQYVYTRTNAAGHKETYNSYDVHGSVASLTDSNNIPTTWTYDGFGRKTQESRPGSSTTLIYYLCWDGSVPASDTKCPAPTGPAITRVQTETSGAGWSYTYHDIFGRVVQTNTQGFGGNWIYKQTQYDNLGRVTSVSHPYFDGETVHCTTYSHDALGRVRTITEPGPTTTDCANTSGGRVTTTTYNGLATTVTSPPTAASPGGQQKTTVKNSQGQVVQAIDNPSSDNLITTYTYDSFGNLTLASKSYDAGTDIAMTYNLRGFKTRMVDPDMGTWNYTYDVLGQMKTQTDNKGQKISMAYDPLGRMTSRVLPNGEGTSTWTYGTAVPEIGKLKTVSNPNATETYAYDSLSRVSSATTSIGGITYTTSYTYDAYSRPLTLTYPMTGFKLYHVYDLYGHLTEARRDTATGLRYWKADTFDAHGRLTKETLGNNLISTRAYHHETGDLQTIKTGTGTSSTSVQNSSFTFDALDNLTARGWWDGAALRSESFGYDTLNRLTTVTGPANKTYAYAPNGNIAFKSDVGVYSYIGSRPHAVSQVAGYVNTTYAYDANGNMLTGNGRTISYTSFNKPKTIVKGTVTATYGYGPTGQRLTQTTPTRSVVYIGKLHESETENGAAKDKNYIYAGANLVAMYRKAADGSSYVRYFHTDHLGSVEVVTDESRAISQRRAFDAFGKNRNVNGTDTTAASNLWFAKRGYTGHEHDDEIGLINMNAREYDYVIGRFITPDTIIPGGTNSQAFNRYSYVNNNPLSFTDPTGHSRLSRAVRRVVNAHKRVIDWHERAVEKAKNSEAVRMVVAAAAAYYTAGAASSWFLSSASGSAFATSAFASESLAYAYGAQTAIYVGGGIVGGAAAGAVSGGTMCGSDCARSGAKGGAIAGGIFAGANLMSEDWNAYGRVGTKGVAGGLSNDLQGRSFSAGFRYNSLYYGAQEYTDSLASGKTTTVPGSGKLDTVGGRAILPGGPGNASIFSKIAMSQEGAPSWWDPCTACRNLVVDVSKVHDTGNSFMYSGGYFAPTGNVILDSLADVYSFSTMLPAASFTLKGPQYGGPVSGPMY